MTCGCGCGERTPLAGRTDSRKGWVKGQPMRFIRHHHLRKHPLEFIVHPLGCWEWTGSRLKAGYGLTWRDGRKVLAHRAYYEEWCGPIPPGMVIDHLCENPCCVFPPHLEVVTNAENTRRGRKALLNVRAVRAIRRGGCSRDEFARQFGVSRDAVDHVLRGDRWADVA